MAFQESVAVRNARLAGLVSTLEAGTGTTLTAIVIKLFSGAEPANCAAADPSGLLATINSSSTPFGTPSAGAVSLATPWTGTATATGAIASWRIYDSSLVCHIQGNTTDMSFSSTSISTGQAITINSFTITAGNA